MCLFNAFFLTLGYDFFIFIREKSKELEVYLSSSEQSSAVSLTLKILNNLLLTFLPIKRRVTAVDCVPGYLPQGMGTNE